MFVDDQPATCGSVTIFLIDDEAMIRAGLRALLEQDGAFKVVRDSGNARASIEWIEKLRPDLVILDITMPGLSGFDAVALIKKASPHTKVLIASQHEGHNYVRRALEAGADGYLSKSSDPAELRLAVESIHRGDSFLSPRVAGALVGRFVAGHHEKWLGSPLDSLTPREREVLQLIAVGKPNKSIAVVLGISLGTVKKHRENLQRKLDCHSAAGIARLAIREGLLTL